MTPAEFTAAVREMADMGHMSVSKEMVRLAVSDHPADGHCAAYRYATLMVPGAGWRERIVPLVELATRISGYVTIHCTPGTAPCICLAISRDLTPDEIAALPVSSRDVPLDDVIGEVAGER